MPKGAANGGIARPHGPSGGDPAPRADGWHFGAVWEIVAAAQPDHPAQVQGARIQSWAQFEARAGGVAAALRDAGLARQAKVALYLYNAPEYMEAAFAAMKAGLVPVNTNYRYLSDELHYLWDNADAEAVVFHADFAAIVDALRPRCPKVRLWLCVATDNAPCPGWAADYAAAATGGRRFAAAERGPGEDHILIYTGGSTGLPKGVIWRQHDLYMASNVTGDPATADPAAVRARLGAGVPRPVGLSAAPLMHGTGFVFAMSILNRGGTLVTAEERSFDAARLLDAIVHHRVTALCIVGDAFARPLVEALDARPGHWDLGALQAVSSSGMVWSAEIKERFLAHAPDAVLIDFLNSSEASGMGRSIRSGRSVEAGGAGPVHFRLGAQALILDDEGRPLSPGSERLGRLAVRGHIPLGYYKDPVKTAQVFPVIDGVRHAVPGDFARYLPDGTVALVGRGSTSINTGGEKVFPEEVEETIKTLPGVRDALVVGLPDPRFGERIAAAVAVAPGAGLTEAAVIAHVRARLAGHKVPRHVLLADDIGRTVTGKADYPAIRARLAAWLQGAEP